MKHTQCESNNIPPPEVFRHFFTNGWEFLVHILHICFCRTVLPTYFCHCSIQLNSTQLFPKFFMAVNFFPNFSWPFVWNDPVIVCTKFEVCSFTESRDNRGYRKNGQSNPWICPIAHCPHSLSPPKKSYRPSIQTIPLYALS